MRKFTHFVILSLVSFAFFTSCKGPKFLLKKDARIDTLHLELDLRIVQQFEYKQEILKKMTKFVDVYNSETHPFKLSLNSGIKTTACQVRVIRVKFVRPKENVLSTVVSVAGIGTAAALIVTGFPVPFGWLYIPSARTSITPVMSTDISDVTDFQRVGISSVGMYRKLNKQIDKQSSKFVKYMVSVVQTIEQEYTANNKH
jgi:hypothetical protein